MPQNRLAWKLCNLRNSFEGMPQTVPWWHTCACSIPDHFKVKFVRHTCLYHQLRCLGDPQCQNRSWGSSFLYKLRFFFKFPLWVVRKIETVVVMTRAENVKFLRWFLLPQELVKFKLQQPMRSCTPKSQCFLCKCIFYHKKEHRESFWWHYLYTRLTCLQCFHCTSYVGLFAVLTNTR